MVFKVTLGQATPPHGSLLRTAPKDCRDAVEPSCLCAGDVSTDGRWCFMIFKVTLGQAMPPHWSLLRRRLEAICPSTHGDHSMWRYTSRTRDTQHPFLLQVTSYDRRGFLHGESLLPTHIQQEAPSAGTPMGLLTAPTCPWLLLDRRGEVVSFQSHSTSGYASKLNMHLGSAIANFLGIVSSVLDCGL